MNIEKAVIFINETKKNPNSPDYEAIITENGIDMKYVAWKKKTKEGKKYISIAKSRPIQQSEPEQQQGEW